MAFGCFWGVMILTGIQIPEVGARCASEECSPLQKVVRLDSNWEASRLSRQPSTVSQQLSLRMKSSQSLLDLDEDVPREREDFWCSWLVLNGLNVLT